MVRVSSRKLVPRFFDLDLWSRGMEYWLFHRADEYFVGLVSDDREPDDCRSSIGDPESSTQDAFLSSLLGFHQAPLMGFPKIPSIGLGSRRPLLL